jgi:hypothetical protein
MTNDDIDVGFTDDVWPARTPGGSDARAYGGPAHGQQWALEENEPPAWIELAIGAASCLYRLVRQPRTGRPAHDYLGNYLYVPIAAMSPAADEECRVLRFPTGGQAGRRHA